jgi:type VI secretion system protein ImpK
MKFLSPSSERAALVSREPSVAPASAGGIRDLLRDTALFVANLTTGGTAENFDTLRRGCLTMIEQFDAALRHRRYPDDVREDAVMAQCALLDETALHCLSESDKVAWSTQPLQVQKFKQHDAGERVFDRLDFRMRERSPQVDLLECYAAILGLGFLGRYALEGKDKRQALIGELNALIERLRPDGEPSFIIDQAGRRFGDWLHRLSPWAIAGIACVIALVTWLAWHAALDAQLASVIPNAVKP